MARYKCPKCGNTEKGFDCHVSVYTKVDADGEIQANRLIDDISRYEVDEDAHMTCGSCSYSAEGENFIV